MLLCTADGGGLQRRTQMRDSRLSREEQVNVWFWRALDSVCRTEWNRTNIQLDEFNVLLSLKKVRKELPAN